MQLMHVSSFLAIAWTVALILSSLVQANTEKIIFAAKFNCISTTDRFNSDLQEDQGAVDPTRWKQMVPPHTIVRFESILPKNVQSSSLAYSNQTHSQTENSKWYVLQGLEDSVMYELRVSYPASSPADFNIAVWTLSEAQKYLSKDLRLDKYFTKNVMLAHVDATYTGISYLTNKDQYPEKLPIPYNLVLERLYFRIPYQALKLAVTIAVVAIIGLKYIVPKAHSALKEVSSMKEKGD
ncbi:hypothetical protein BX616_000007 [Lobosporangium transversale]|uniref:Phosphatidylinositol-glycan biosynthesis class X protein n=1 Tax=Lobosporangium transversale TaxID=64571 RepID=A0A1Y2GD35_9FUNG|nr:hypothetical protein BCR41DRAFT_425838 [Lobosporangium transversale]KAF9919396.1 hypothetical protein BX616_000007 [Lobosporangium transversale]ORZ04528.1 hypothetical protein BCR41DRAFT_425838 [Lobosporangium transversale]|eukprot:XP_021876574.1 hypothetical protein BCR41DRAFT_425838 [Lobosporangium transversale]